MCLLVFAPSVSSGQTTPDDLFNSTTVQRLDLELQVAPCHVRPRLVERVGIGEGLGRVDAKLTPRHEDPSGMTMATEIPGIA